MFKLLSAIILTNENYDYYVTFSQHHPQLQMPEYVRLLLHYYAKILFNFDPSDPEMFRSAWVLKKMMDAILGTGIKKNIKILDVVDISDVVKIVSSKPRNVPRQIVGTLYFVNVRQRHITTNIPQNIYTQHTVFSVMVLLQLILTKIDEDCIDILNRSLKNMHAAYDTGQSFSEIKNLTAIPTTAYLLAIEGE